MCKNYNYLFNFSKLLQYNIFFIKHFNIMA